MLHILLFLTIALTGTYSQTSKANTACTFESKLKPLCEEIESLDKSQADDLPRTWRGSQLPSLNTLKSQVADFEKRPAKGKLTPEEKKKYSAALEKAKTHAERVLLLGPDRQTLRLESELTSAEKATLDRVRKIKLSNLENPLHAMVCTDEGYIGHAVTSPDIIVCPILNGYSEATLVHAIGTFIGRGLTECASTLPKAMGGTMDPIPWNEHPFKTCTGPDCSSLQQCLRSGAEGQIRETSSASIDFESELAKKSIATIQRLNSGPGKNPPSADQLKDMLKPMIKSHPSCFHQYNGSQEDSGMSYWFGAEVAASYASEEEKAGRAVDREGVIAYFADDACRFHKLKDIRAVNGHPTHGARFEKAMLRSTSFRSMLGCTKPPSEPVDCHIKKPSLKNEKPAHDGTGFPTKSHETAQ
ncbi:MAG: hypothetical protein U1E10_15485 [Bdellovibrionales bacterium]|nr:hypothetical protein [Bdellovibrionales bacterium]